MRTSRLLRELLNQPGVIRSLGAHDVFTARLVEAAGLETVFIGGFGTSASLLGLPDVGTVTAGAVADLIVVDGDPAADVRVLREPDRIWMVVQKGRIVAGRSPAAELTAA